MYNSKGTESAMERPDLRRIGYFYLNRHLQHEMGFNMVRYLLVAIVLSLVGCVPTGVKITGDNNQINTPYYSIMVPPNEGWHQNQDHGDLDLSYFEKTTPPSVYIMRFSTNLPVDKSMRTWTAKQVADDYRNGEQANMIMMGVMAGLYELKDVVMGEEMVGDNHFYTMTYATIENGIEQRASLYLHFPREQGFSRFLVALYSETHPVNEFERKSFRGDFIQTLNSLKMTK
jgi:hypothetical protein